MKKVLLSLIACHLALAMLSQEFEPALKKWSAQFPAEKIAIHFDQEWYVPGETIWYKAYLYNNGQPSGVSNNLYLQFINNKGEVIDSHQNPVSGAVAWGNMELPDSLPQGNYYIRAFTPGMLNRDPSLIYQQRIPVFRPGETTTTAGAEGSTFNLAFFPESGKLVNGIVSVVAFKATDSHGRPAEVSGVIKSTDGSTLATFRSLQDGMGKFQLLPVSGMNYIAEVQSGGQKIMINLPPIEHSGINLHVEDEKTGKVFQLSRSEKNKELFDRVFLVADINQQIVYENEIAFEDYFSVKGHLLTDSMPSGILHFTVFDKKGMLLAERLSFVDNGEYRSPGTITVIQPGQGKRTEAVIELSFPDKVQRNFSVAAYPAEISPGASSGNIYSRFLLTGDLGNSIPGAARYLEKRDEQSIQSLDNLMLTQAWMGFNWKKILAGDLPHSLSAAPLLSVTGQVMDEKNREHYSGGNLAIYLEAADSTTQSLQAAVDNEGRFRLDSLLFFGNAKLFYAYTDRNGKQKDVKVILDEDPTREKIKNYPFVLPGPDAEIMQPITAELLSRRFRYSKTKMDEVKELERVTLSAKNRKPSELVNDRYTTGVFRGQSKVLLDLIHDPVNDKSQNVVDYIRNRIQQVEIQGNSFVNRKNISLQTGRKWAVGVFLNEIPADLATLRTTRMTDVALIKFFEAGFVGVGSGSPGGAIAVYTKASSEDQAKPDKLPFVVVNGYATVKEFTGPGYTEKDKKSPSVDERATLYWNPDVFLDMETRKMQVRFFNNDSAGRIKVVVEGFDAAGRLIYMEKVIDGK